MPTQAIEDVRGELSRATTAEKKASLGQFFTPATTAAFMAGMFRRVDGACRLLDAGAGIGSLSSAFVERWKSGGFAFDSVQVDAWEIDSAILPHLRATGAQLEHPSLQYRIHHADFVLRSAERLERSLFSSVRPVYTHAILNPPYRKLGATSEHRLALRGINLDSGNLYSAFLSLSVEQMEEGGEVVAIVPRSFCNGPYYKVFRAHLLRRASIVGLHLFESRTAAFKDDGVLQENIIIHLLVGVDRLPVNVSVSSDDSFADLRSVTVDADAVVHKGDRDFVIHVPDQSQESSDASRWALTSTIKDLGISVSTGPVVDFRLRAHLRDEPEHGTVPLLYSGHFRDGRSTWPDVRGKKPSWIVSNSETERWLYAPGTYCVVRRFSSKEERRRIVSSVLSREEVSTFSAIGFENHLNVFHIARGGVDANLAFGLMCFLNSEGVDVAFRRRSGHTQVNVSDLTAMRYPNAQQLRDLGQWARTQAKLPPELVDEEVERRFG